MLLWRGLPILAAVDALTMVAAYLGHVWLSGADTGPLSSYMVFTRQGHASGMLASVRADSKRGERRSSERQSDVVMLFGVDPRCSRANQEIASTAACVLPSPVCISAMEPRASASAPRNCTSYHVLPEHAEGGGRGKGDPTR